MFGKFRLRRCSAHCHLSHEETPLRWLTARARLVTVHDPCINQGSIDDATKDADRPPSCFASTGVQGTHLVEYVNPSFGSVLELYYCWVATSPGGSLVMHGGQKEYQRLLFLFAAT